MAVLVRFVLVHGFSVKALWLRRSFATGEWEPGRSDIDFGICITAAEPVTEPRVYTRVARCLEWMKKFIWVISEIESYTAADLAIERKFGEKGREALNWKFLHGRAADFPDYQFHPLKYKIDASLELLVVLLMFGRTLTLQARPNQPDIYLSRRFVKALWDILRWSAVIGEDFGFETNTPLTRAQLQQFLHRLPHEHFLRAQAAQLAELDGSDAGLIGKHYAYLIDHLSRSAEALNVQLRSAGLKNQVWERNPAAACTVGQTACCLRTGFYAELDFYELTSPLDGGFFADFVASRHAGGNSAVICTSSLSELLSLSLPDNAASYFASSPVDTELARLFLFQQAALQLRALSRISS
ncbi:MAG TPA: hypothetical protein PLP17_16390, partial [Oligoflexia bacterium]|nr:hypothetical protein [Oligoflexia bacterium]